MRDLQEELYKIKIKNQNGHKHLNQNSRKTIILQKGYNWKEEETEYYEILF